MLYDGRMSRRAFLLSVVALLFLSGCVDPYARDPSFARDDVFCWHRAADGQRWVAVGLQDRCPPNAWKANVRAPYP